MSVRMSEEEYQRLKGEEAKEEAKQVTAEEFKGVHQKYDQAVAIDPGKSSGVACVKHDGQVYAWDSTFWKIVDPFGNRPTECHLDTDRTCILLEAPYLSRPGMNTPVPAKAYNSGRVAREAELLEARLTDIGYEVEGFDPARYDAGKWSSKMAHHMVGGWDGPDNGDVRDAIRLLVFYNFV